MPYLVYKEAEVITNYKLAILVECDWLVDGTDDTVEIISFLLN